MKTLSIEGRAYTLCPLDAGQVQAFLDFARDAMPCPIQQLLDAGNKLPEAMREKFIQDRLDAAFDASKKRGTLSDPDLEAFIYTPAGYQRLYGLMFKRHHPELTDVECWKLACTAVEEHGVEALQEIYQSSKKIPMKEEDVESNYFRGKGNTAKKRRR